MSPDVALTPLLEVDGLHKSFGGNRVLRGLSFTLPRSSVTALIGSNGAGKSTFLNVLSGIVPADSGAIHLGGIDLMRLGAYRRARAGLTRTFQHPRAFRSFTVMQALVFAQTPPRAEHLFNSVTATLWPSHQSSAEMNKRAVMCLERCHLDHKAKTQAAELSYGEQKLLMMAQAMAFDGQLLCFDELCAGLQPALIDRIAAVVLELAAEGRTILFIEHNLELVRTIAARCLFLHEGTVFREGPTEDVLSDSDVVRMYLGD